MLSTAVCIMVFFETTMKVAEVVLICTLRGEKVPAYCNPTSVSTFLKANFVSREYT